MPYAFSSRLCSRWVAGPALALLHLSAPLAWAADPAVATAPAAPVATSTWTAIQGAGFVYLLAIIISFGVAFLVKGLASVLRKLEASSRHSTPVE